VSRIAYVNGRFVPHAGAAVHIEDRGFQFGDAVYEVWSVRGGVLYDRDGHFDRLERSLAELQIHNPRSRASLAMIIEEVLRRNRIRDGLVYLQISRGVARRDHAFPRTAITPTLVLTAKAMNFDALAERAMTGIAVITVPDIRWQRCDIKSVNLLPNVLAKQAAVEAGAVEAWQIDGEGNVTEGSSTNAWILTADGILVTRPADEAILKGITRGTVLRCAEALGYTVEERKFSVEEALAAREAFLTSATTFVTPITRIDDQVIANGVPGSMAQALRAAYLDVQ
jgi:D-alanine transaminase